MENAVDVWINLKEHFSQGDLVHISKLMQENFGMQQDSKSVIDFYSDLKIKLEKLYIYLPIPTCTIHNKFACEVMCNARKHHTTMYAIKFLTKLNPNFVVVKS